MTRKHFEAIAAVLAGDYASAANAGERNKVRGIALSLADVFAGTNPRFNRSRFYVAVGLTEAGFSR
jgi:hypothetical protein